jgi:hypothetical protein
MVSASVRLAHGAHINLGCRAAEGQGRLAMVVGGAATVRHRTALAARAVCGRPPLLVVARNLGHTDTRMVERHYGHLAPSYITEAIHAGAPRYGVKGNKRVIPLR